MQSLNISIALDRRSKLKDGRHPVKLMVFYKGKQKRYSLKGLTNITHLKSVEFDAIRDNSKSKYLEERTEFNAIENKAYEISKSINPFSFHQFEKKMFSESEEQDLSLINSFKKYSEKKYNENAIRTGESYESAMNSFTSFLEFKKYRVNEFQLIDIDSKFLDEYENWMLSKGRSLSTVGVYNRNLRTLVNQLINKGILERKSSPFIEYTIPATRKSNICLDFEDIPKLYHLNTINPLWDEARDFWFISYLTNGANMKDLLNLRMRDINLEENEITFIRAKTALSSRKELETITVPLIEKLKIILEKQGSLNGDKDDFVFPLLNDKMDEREKTKVIKNFTRKVNQHINKAGKSIGIKHISFQMARHTFSNMLLNIGASTEMIQFSLGHKNPRTTQKYLRGFTSKKKNEMAMQLLKDV